jgi:hypothetical protein
LCLSVNHMDNFTFCSSNKLLDSLRSSSIPELLMYLCLSLYRDSQSAFELFLYYEISEQWVVQELNVRPHVRHRKTPKCAVIALRYVGLTFCCGQCGGRVHSGSMWIQIVQLHSTWLPRDGSPGNVETVLGYSSLRVQRHSNISFLSVNILYKDIRTAK